MDLSFTTVVIGLLKNLAVDVAANLVSGEILKSISAQELVSLLEDCLADAVKQKSELLNRFTSPANLDGSKPEVYLDRERLRAYLEKDTLVQPLTSEMPTSRTWRPYLKPFRDIIVIPGCTLTESDYLDHIQQVFEVAAKIFEANVPFKQPAFDQLLLGYQKRHSIEHKQILERLDSLPQQTADEIRQGQEKKPTAEPAASDLDIGSGWLNPFSVVAADDLDLTNPDHVRQIRNLFIARYSELPTIRKRFNTMLEGQRGTGKTMILKYLGFETQILEWTDKFKRPASEFLTTQENFIGVYSKLGQGVYDKSDFEAIDSPARRGRIFEHRLTLQLLYDVLGTMRSLFQYYPPPAEEVRRIRKALQAYLKVDGTLDSCATYEELIRFAQDYISFTLIPEVDEHLGSVSPGAGGNPTNFNPRLTLAGQLFQFLRLLQESSKASVPFFIMLDDFDVLEAYQQTRVFKAASQREFSIVCFKFGVMVLGKKVPLSGQDRTFRPGDDYDPINLDWTQGGLHDNYQEAVMEIAAARLQDSTWPNDLSALLPTWRRGQELSEEIKQEMGREWDAAVEKQTESKSDYISKRGNARLFQRLRRHKISMRYAGLEYVTMVSSGIFRQFLEVCKLIFDRAHDRNWFPGVDGVSPEIQDEAIREYSDEMMQQFTRTSGDAQALLSGDIEVTSQHMVTLIESLSDVFYSRLHTPGSGDPEIICIAIRDDLNEHPDAYTYLKIAVRESILHRFQYPPKTAGGPSLPAFMLNRRLGPRRDLSICRMQGRIEVKATDVLLAVSDRKRFFEAISAQEESEASRQMTLQFKEDRK